MPPTTDMRSASRIIKILESHNATYELYEDKADISITHNGKERSVSFRYDGSLKDFVKSFEMNTAEYSSESIAEKLMIVPSRRSVNDRLGEYVRTHSNSDNAFSDIISELKNLV